MNEQPSRVGPFGTMTYEGIIRDQLDQLTRARDGLETLQVNLEDEINLAMPEEVRTRIRLIRETYQQAMDRLRSDISALEDLVRQNTLLYGQSVRSERMMAVWSGGRVSWDDQALSGYALAHPEIAKLRKVGAPSVSIRKT